MRQSLLVAGVLLLATPTFAEDAVPSAGRYAIQPSDDGFVRLDTETGAVSHCTRTGHIWHCDAVTDDKAALENKVAELSAEVASLNAEIGKLRTELADLKGTPGKGQTELSPEDEKEFDRAMGFAERLMKRFFEMVRDLKGAERPSI
jgi:hypothetical protein